MKKFKEQLQQMSESSQNLDTMRHFSSLLKFIDNSLVDSYKKEGDDKVASLATCLFNMRDYLSKTVHENSVRQQLLNDMIMMVENLNEDGTVKKKESELETQNAQEESGSESDQETLSQSEKENQR